MNKRDSEEQVTIYRNGLLNDLHPKVKMELARDLLKSLIDQHDITYANFEAAQSAERHIKRAYRELNGLM